MDEKLPIQLLEQGVSLDEINKSLSFIIIDDIENEQASETGSKCEPQFCSSTPVRTNFKHCFHNTDSTHDLGAPPPVNFCTSNENCQIVTPPKDDDILIIDASMSTLSIVGNEETRLDCQDNSLCNEPVPTCAVLKGRGEGDAQSVSTKNICTKSDNDDHMSIVITDQSKILDDVSNVIAAEYKSKKNLCIESKSEVKGKQNILKPKSLKEVKNELATTTVISIPKKSDNLQLLEFRTSQSSTRRETQMSKERKQSRRKKFLHDKKKKNLAESRAKKSEDKENIQETIYSGLQDTTNQIKLSVQEQECLNTDKKPVKCVLQVIQNWIGEAPPEKKDSERKIQEFVSDDQKENLDINDPEWDNLKCLKTDDERYKAVKACWKSQGAPNPQKDLTFHSYRYKRVKRDKTKLSYIKKRPATGSIENSLVTKVRKMEEAPCTLFLDQKITDAKKQFTSQQNDHHLLFNQTKKQLDKNYAKKNSNIMTEYYRELYHINNMRADFFTQRWLRTSLENWLNMQKKWLHENLLDEIENAKKQKDKVLSDLSNNHCFTLKKLEDARNEVLKFNQFYCGLNEIDPTVLRGQFLQEIVAIEDMYLTYEKNYGLRH